MADESCIHIVDDDDAMRESLAFLLETAGLNVRAYESSASFLAGLPFEQPACLVTDVRMPDMTGIDLLRRLKDAGHLFPIIIITGHGDVSLAVEAMKLGAADFIEKPFDDEVLLTAIRSAQERLQQSGPDESARAEAAARLSALSKREREVLDGLVAGQQNKTIAFNLGISPRTVEVYRANLMTKLHASSLSDLVRIALLAEGITR
jgi:two-component system response regulator FixJ